MELTFESAFSANGFLGHSAYLLLVVSMLMRSMVWLRILVILSSLVGIAYFALILSDPVSVFWETLLVVVNVVQLAIIAWRNRRARFTAEEAALAGRCFAGLPPGLRRAILDLGRWETVAPGHALCRQGRPVPALCYIGCGEVTIEVDGVEIGRAGPGRFVGEMTVATGGPASATVCSRTELRLWRVEADRLRPVLKRQGELGRALEASFFRDLREKLMAQNATMRAGIRDGGAAGTGAAALSGRMA